MGFFNNIFKNKAEAPAAEKIKTPEEIISQPETVSKTEKATSETEPKNFTERLDNLKKAMEDMETQGMKLSEGVLENIMDMNVGEFMEYVSGGENIKEKDIKSLHDNISQILKGELNEAHQGGRLKELLRKPASKIAFVTLLLFLKFAPHSQAHEAPVKDASDVKNKTEKFEGGDGTKPDGGPDKTTYNIDQNSMENMAVMDLTNNYETDQALISEAEANEIQTNFKAFLDKVNSKNIDEVMKLDFKIYGSSDERPTKTWKGGNLELTQTRINVAEGILQNELKNHDFSNTDLSPEQIKQLQNKEFKHGIPEDGVTHITDLVNPDTGKNYTDAEVNALKKTNLTQYNELLKSCRYIKVNLMAHSEETKPLVEVPPTMEVTTKIEISKITTDLISEYDQTIILFDNSASMTDSKAYMGSELQKIDKEANIKIATFTNELNEMTAANNFKQAGEALKNTSNKGNSHERSVFVASEALNNFDFDGDKMMESKLLLINTDEAIQTTKVEMEKLLAESQAKGVKVYFNLGYDNNKQVLKVSLEEVNNNLKQIYEKKLAKINEDIAKSNAQLENKELKKEFRKIVKDRLEKLNKQLEELPNLELKVKTFVTPDGRVINMEATS